MHVSGRARLLYQQQRPRWLKVKASYSGVKFSFSTDLELVFISFEEVFLAPSLLLFLLLLIILLQLSWTNDQVELGHGDHPWVTVRPVERDLQSDLSNEAWEQTRECTDQGRERRMRSSKTTLLLHVLKS